MVCAPTLLERRGASMRPRRARLGYLVDPTNDARFTSRFNEAEARTPRIHTADSDPRSPRRFNEAEARTPRIPATSASSVATRHDASMRPRRARLGYGRRLAAADADGSRFNEAEARTPRMHRAWKSTDVRRRCFNEAEARTPRMHRRGAHRCAKLPLASMRPRRARLGCAIGTNHVRRAPAVLQ